MLGCKPKSQFILSVPLLHCLALLFSCDSSSIGHNVGLSVHNEFYGSVMLLSTNIVHLKVNNCYNVMFIVMSATANTKVVDFNIYESFKK